MVWFAWSNGEADPGELLVIAYFTSTLLIIMFNFHDFYERKYLSRKSMVKHPDEIIRDNFRKAFRLFLFFIFPYIDFLILLKHRYEEWYAEKLVAYQIDRITYDED